MSINNSNENGKLIITPGPSEKRAAIEEVLQSTTFLRSGQLQKFLRFICEMEIMGRANEINEYMIGIEALGQGPDYSPAENAVVRRRAIDLRKKLEEVYAAELADAKLRIHLPKGKYIPRFVLVEHAEKHLEESPSAFVPEVLGPGKRGMKIPFKALFLAFAFFAVGIIVASLFFRVFPTRMEATGASLLKPGKIYEAEARTNTLNGRTRIEPCSTCSNGARLRIIGFSPQNYVVVNNVTVEAGGNHVVTIYYLLNGKKSFFVSVNGDPGVEVPMEGNSWLVPKKVSIVLPLEVGSNTIKFYNDNSYAPDLDLIVVD